MGKIWFTSDLHFGHDRDFIYGPRGFNSVHEMNEALIKNFIDDIAWEDEVYILGDCMLGDNSVGLSFLKRIPGKKHIILGNHDTNARVDLYKDVYQTDIIGYATMFKYHKFTAFLSHYPTLTGNYDDKGSHVVWNLSGHTHSREKFQYWPSVIYNVAVDAHGCHPVEIETVIVDIKKQKEVSCDA